MVRLEVSTHSGAVDTVEVEHYNVDLIVNEINNQENHVIALGNNIYSKIDIKKITKIENEM